jgi:hypothetical protein
MAYTPGMIVADALAANPAKASRVIPSGVSA